MSRAPSIAESESPGELGDELDALEADARQQIEAAESAEARLSLDALTDPEMASQLAAAQSERRSAEDACRQVELARQERTRRAEQAERDRVQAKRAGHLHEARRLQGERERAASAVDEAALAYARALTHFDRTVMAQIGELQGAGEAGKPTPPWAPTAGLLWATSAAAVPVQMIQTEAIRASKVPLAQGDARPVDPLGDGD